MPWSAPPAPMKFTRVLACASLLLATPLLNSVHAADHAALSREQRASMAELRKALAETTAAIRSVRQDVKLDRDAKGRERRNGSTESRKEAHENLNPAKARELQALLDRKVELERKMEKLQREADEAAEAAARKDK